MNGFSYSKEAPPSTNVGLKLRQPRCIKTCSLDYISAPVVIGITHHNQPQQLSDALKSAITQSMIGTKQAQIYVLDDSSDLDIWDINTELLKHPSVSIWKAECGSPARARNTILDLVDVNSQIKWVARLDADDLLATENSLEALIAKGEEENSDFIIGSNLLKTNGRLTDSKNIASEEILKAPAKLAAFIQRFCLGQEVNELPSCNLVLRTGLSQRYPNFKSAEDHWMVAKLLLVSGLKCSVVSEPFYSIYSLDGHDTAANKSEEIWGRQRNRLAEVANHWVSMKLAGHEVLGAGLEGFVVVCDMVVKKTFYSWTMDDNEQKRISDLLRSDNDHIPNVSWSKENGLWSYETPFIPLESLSKKLKIPLTSVEQYLIAMYRAGICTSDLKRANLKLSSNKLICIDIGRDIQKLTSSRFLDMCARLYSIAVLGNPDEELVRRKSFQPQDKALQELTGFDDFYCGLINKIHPYEEGAIELPAACKSSPDKPVSLMIKCCAQDHAQLYEQVTHIVTQLSFPRPFEERVLLIDTYQGTFLRQYDEGRLDLVFQIASQLQVEGYIDRILISPNQDASEVHATYQKWFNQSVLTTHTDNEAPLFPQIWAFDQIDTDYVLQCDCDVLVGRKNLTHDYLSEMISEVSDDSVLSVGFNIPKSTDQFLDYFGDPGQFPPEVRMGLLDLKVINDCLPIANPVVNGSFTLTWHRAIQQLQKKGYFRSVRGGAPDSFYIHPRNEDKEKINFSMLRDIVAQGLYPNDQAERFDLHTACDWSYPKRNEDIVFLLKGRNTPSSRLNRCIKSLKSQIDQNYGIIFIDDDSGRKLNWQYPKILSELKGQYTLIRRERRVGRIPNFIYAIDEICGDQNPLIVVLDQDDWLMHNRVVAELRNAMNEGADLIQMPMFRPDKPSKLYPADYDSPRKKAGGNVWSHMRAFKKDLFNQIPKDYFRVNDEWIPVATDYATMLPMAELAEKPMYIDGPYAYHHQRTDSKSEPENNHRMIEKVLVKPNLRSIVVGNMQAHISHGSYVEKLDN